MRTKNTAASVATQPKRKPLVRRAPKPPATQSPISPDRRAVTFILPLETIAAFQKLAEQEGMPIDDLAYVHLQTACRNVSLTVKDYEKMARDCRRAERAALAHKLPTTEIYTRTSLKLQELAESSGMTRCRLATLALDYALGKLETGALKISVPTGPINFTAAGGIAR